VNKINTTPKIETLKYLLDLKLHLLVILVSLLAEWIGIIKIPIGIGALVLLPLLYAFIFALLLNPNVISSMKAVITKDRAAFASYAVILSIMPFIAKFGVGVGPKIEQIVAAGPALLLQELGNVATVVIALPVAVLVFGMGREAVGATHSIAREPNIALVADKYGLKSPEGIGVMGVYVMGTLFGAIYFSLMAGVIASMDIMDIRALAMACGIGSGSMMGACAATLAEIAPAQEEIITAFAATSNLLTYATGLFVSLFIALPLAEFLYKNTSKFKKGSATEAVSYSDFGTDVQEQSILSFGQSIALLSAICGVLLLSNWVGQDVNPIVALPGMLILFACCVAGILLKQVIPINVPSVAWISIVAIIISLPQSPFNSYILQETEKLGVLQLITPVLAYAGFAISQMEVNLFRKSGFKIAVVALLTFTGTFLGSAMIAQAIL
jgi:MFS family permease